MWRARVTRFAARTPVNRYTKIWRTLIFDGLKWTSRNLLLYGKSSFPIPMIYFLTTCYFRCSHDDRLAKLRKMHSSTSRAQRRRLAKHDISHQRWFYLPARESSLGDFISSTPLLVPAKLKFQSFCPRFSMWRAWNGHRATYYFMCDSVSGR